MYLVKVNYEIILSFLFIIAFLFLVGTPAYNRKKRYNEVKRIFTESGRELLSFKSVKNSDCPYYRELSADGACYVSYRIVYNESGQRLNGWAIRRMFDTLTATDVTSVNLWIFRN